MLLSRKVSLLFMRLVSWSILILLVSCATDADQKHWIQIGQTTRNEVVARYGPPDVVIASGDGEIAIYRPREPRQSPARVEVPTVQAGPLGTATTKMEPINPGFGSGSSTGGSERPRQELRIRYDAKGVVRELTP